MPQNKNKLSKCQEIITNSSKKIKPADCQNNAKGQILTARKIGKAASDAHAHKIKHKITLVELNALSLYLIEYGIFG